MFTITLKLFPAFEKPAHCSDLARQFLVRMLIFEVSVTGNKITELAANQSFSFSWNIQLWWHTVHHLVLQAILLLHNKKTQKNQNRKKKNPKPWTSRTRLGCIQRQEKNQTNLSSNGLRLEWMIFHLFRFKVPQGSRSTVRHISICFSRDLPPTHNGTHPAVLKRICQNPLLYKQMRTKSLHATKPQFFVVALQEVFQLLCSGIFQ